MIIALVVLCLLFVGAYFWMKSSAPPPEPVAAQSTSAPPPPPPVVAAPSPPVVTGPSDALKSLWSTGQKIQDTELEVGTATVPMATAPFGYSLTAPPVYSMTMDIMISQTGDRWRNIMEHGPSTGNDFPPGATFRRPSVFVTGSDSAPANRIMVTHANAAGENTNVTTTNQAPLGKYFTLTWVVYNGTLTVYWNGVADPSGPISSQFNWPSTDQPWSWNQGNYIGNIAGSIKVKNVYYWNRSLASSDIAVIASQYAAAPGVSHYDIEPYDEMN